MFLPDVDQSIRLRPEYFRGYRKPDGRYVIDGQYPGTNYQIRFRDPRGTAILGTPGGSRIPSMVLLSALSYLDGEPVQAIRFRIECIPGRVRMHLPADSPLRLRLRVDPAQWRWLLAFMMACRSSVNARNGAQLLALALESQAALTRWREEDGLTDFAWRRNGKLVAYRSERAFTQGRGRLLDQQDLSSTTGLRKNQHSGLDNFCL